MGTIPVKEYIEVPFAVSDRPEAAGMRLDAFLVLRLRPPSRSVVQKFISEGRVFLRGRRAKASTRVSRKDTVIVRYPPRNEPPPLHRRLPVIYEDESVLAVNKPGGVLSHPTGKIVRNSATSILAEQCPGMRLHLTHRLDRETSGLLLLAKNPTAAFCIARQFEKRTVRKAYLAVVRGRISFERRTVDEPIGSEGGRIRLRQAIDPVGGVSAVTDFKRLAAGDRLSLVLARPRTGRLHQIRVHLASLGHPVLGDKLYMDGGEAFLKAVEGTLKDSDFEALGARRHMLHAASLRFTHPEGGKTLRLLAPPPDDFSAVTIKEGLNSGFPLRY